MKSFFQEVQFNYYLLQINKEHFTSTFITFIKSVLYVLLYCYKHIKYFSHCLLYVVFLILCIYKIYNVVKYKRIDGTVNGNLQCVSLFLIKKKKSPIANKVKTRVSDIYYIKKKKYLKIYQNFSKF